MRTAERIALIFATGFGTGYSPVAPGTAGSLLAIPIFIGLSNLNIYLYLLTLFVIFFIGIWSSDFVGRFYNDVDSPRIVIDEIIGLLITYIPLFFLPCTITNLIVGFIFFRILDIIKPFPANRANEIKTPLYVLLDDIIAAVYATILLIIFHLSYRLITGNP